MLERWVVRISNKLNQPTIRAQSWTSVITARAECI